MKLHHKNYVNTTLIVIFSLSLGACGSSGSSTSVFKVGGTITGLSSNGLVLQNNGADDLAVSGTTFEFVTALADGATYDVTVQVQPTGQSCDIASGSGTVDGGNITDVKVICRRWQTAESIDENTESALDAQIAMDAGGNAISVWLAYVTVGVVTEIYVWTNYYTAGSGWGVAELIAAATAASKPQVVMNSSGNATVVWSQFNNIWANQYTAGSGWGTAGVINTVTGNASNPQIAIDDSGNALAVWQQDDGSGLGSGFDIYANRYTAGSGWGAPELIETDNAGKSSSSPQIASNSSGDAVAVWSQNSSIRTNRYVPGSGWGIAEGIETDTGSIGVPQVAINDGGNAVVVWRQSATRAIVWANYYTTGSGWSTAKKIDLENAENADNPQVGIDDSGNAVAVWRQDDGLQFNIYSNRYTAGSGWGSTELIEDINIVDDPKAGIARNPQIAVDRNGNALAVWELDNGSPVSIYANRYTANSGWGNAELIETDDAGNAWSPQVAVSNTGNAVAVWKQYDGTEFNINANRFE